MNGDTLNHETNRCAVILSVLARHPRFQVHDVICQVTFEVITLLD